MIKPASPDDGRDLKARRPASDRRHDGTECAGRRQQGPTACIGGAEYEVTLRRR